MKIYHLKTCDTCRKAIKALMAAKKTPDLVDVRADGIDTADLDRIIEAAGWEAALNTRSTTWRGLSDADKTDINAAKAKALIAAHPTLLKRPAILDGANITVGWKPEQQSVWI